MASEKLTKARARALDLVASGLSRVSHLKMERVGPATITWLSEAKLIDMRFPGSVYITEAGRQALAQGRDQGEGKDG